MVKPVPPSVVGKVAVEIMFFEALRVSIVEAVRDDSVVVPVTEKFPVPPVELSTSKEPHNVTTP